MNDLQSIWGQRFYHYMREVQKYMQYIFTGHLGIVLVFAIGAAGYAYSEWLKEVPADFPSALLVAIVIGGALIFSAPVTLLKPADLIFFLPLEKELSHYIKRSLRWSIFSQLPLPMMLYIVALPLLSATTPDSTMKLLWIVVFIIVLKWVFVEAEFAVRFVTSGSGVWQDRFIRFIIGAVFIYLWLSPYAYLILVPAIGLGVYLTYWRKRMGQKAFPYAHFITLEQDRMMRFYRFANYFTDVPHLKGAISRRSWLGILMKRPAFGETVSQSFLIRRTFIRTDDTFWLWVRLTLLSVVGTYFISIPIAITILVGALAFASSIQLVYALRSGDTFRMDMLFPEPPTVRVQAIQKIVRSAQWIQAFFVFIVSVIAFQVSFFAVMPALVIVIVSELTIRSTKKLEDD